MVVKHHSSSHFRCRSCKTPNSKIIKALLHFECPLTRDLRQARSTCSILVSSVSEILDQASVEKIMPFTNLASRRFRPTATLLVSGSSVRIPDISATFPHPLLLLSSMFSRRVPVAVIMSPRYLCDCTVCISLLCTFNVGQGFLHFETLPT